jgi:hypothetical protein
MFLLEGHAAVHALVIKALASLDVLQHVYSSILSQ